MFPTTCSTGRDPPRENHTIYTAVALKAVFLFPCRGAVLALYTARANQPLITVFPST
jgi:hypothetical protein